MSQYLVEISHEDLVVVVQATNHAMLIPWWLVLKKLQCEWIDEYNIYKKRSSQS